MAIAPTQTFDIPGRQPAAHPRTLVVCDLTDSTALFDRLGDRAATEVTRRHDELARSAMQRHGGHEIDKTDGFLILFERPIQAVSFALEYQRDLRSLAEGTQQPVNARVGIHFGEVVVWENPPAAVAKGAKPVEVEGVAKSVTARLVALAHPGQILISEVAEAMAKRAQDEPGFPAESVRWLAHGRYHVKGVSEPLMVYEVGDSQVAPLRPPVASAKAWPAQHTWRRPAWFAGAGVALLAAAASSAYLWMRNASAISFDERDWVVIGDFASENDDKTLDAMLATAFRIGIEESRFVNVVPDSSVRQALVRMQRGSTTRIDRGIASEIALREQARAVIVPSVSQYGGRTRLVVEVVDPKDERTVATKFADAQKPSDILPAMDRLLRDTRRQLGESMHQIQESSQPLEKVTTPNLEALKVMSHALAMERAGDFDQAERLLRHAIELDSEFATAHSRLGSVLVQRERHAEARAVLEKAASLDNRLTEKERLFLRAFLAEFEDPAAALSEWRLFANLYPDTGTGQNNAGNLHYQIFLDYGAAEAELTKAALPKNPLRNYSLQMLGHVLIAEGKLEEAERQFRAALQFSPAPIVFGLSDALVAGEKFADAARYLDETPKQPLDVEAERAMRRATLLIAQGKVEAARTAVETALSLAERLPSPNARWRAQAAMVALQMAAGDVAAARALVARHLTELSGAAASNSNPLAMEQLLHAAAWAGRVGLADSAGDALDLATRLGNLDRFPARARLAKVARGELDLQAGRLDAIIARGRPVSGDDLWETHEIAARTFRAAGDSAGELAELKWLVAHAGLAYGQWIDQLLGQQARALALAAARGRLAAVKTR